MHIFSLISPIRWNCFGKLTRFYCVFYITFNHLSVIVFVKEATERVFALGHNAGGQNYGYFSENIARANWIFNIRFQRKKNNRGCVFTRDSLSYQEISQPAHYSFPLSICSERMVKKGLHKYFAKMKETLVLTRITRRSERYYWWRYRIYCWVGQEYLPRGSLTYG